MYRGCDEVKTFSNETSNNSSQCRQRDQVIGIFFTHENIVLA